MESLLLFLALGLMSSGVHSISQSKSCSTVNGKTICDEQTSEGNSAMSQSGAAFGGGSSYQQTYAGAGGPGQWDSSSQRVIGGRPSDGSSYGSSSSSSSGSFPTGGFGFVQTGTFRPGPNFPGQGSAQGRPSQGSSYSSSSSSSSGSFPSGGSSNQGPNNGPPQRFDPITFVNGFMGGGFPGAGPFAGGGAFAGPGGAFAGGFGGGAFAFGRR